MLKGKQRISSFGTSNLAKSMVKKDNKIESNMDKSIAVSQRICVRGERHMDKSINRNDKQGSIKSSMSKKNEKVKINMDKSISIHEKGSVR